MKRTSADGIVVQRAPFGERHLVCRLLGRNGRRFAAVFHGGAGGPRRPSVLDLGALVRVELAPGGRRPGGLRRALEWDAVWRHEGIRRSHRAFALLCFYAEVVGRTAVEEDAWAPREPASPGQDGAFRALGHAVLRLDRRAAGNGPAGFFEPALFLAKLLIAEGVFPETRRCIATGAPLAGGRGARLLVGRGGFARADALPAGAAPPGPPEAHEGLLRFLGRAAGERHAEMEDDGAVDRACLALLLDYALDHLHLERRSLRTLGAVS